VAEDRCPWFWERPTPAVVVRRRVWLLHHVVFPPWQSTRPILNFLKLAETGFNTAVPFERIGPGGSRIVPRHIGDVPEAMGGRVFPSMKTFHPWRKPRQYTVIMARMTTPRMAGSVPDNPTAGEEADGFGHARPPSLRRRD